MYSQLTRVTSLIALLGGGEAVLIAPTASIDEHLAASGSVVVEVSREIATAITGLCWEEADVHTSPFGAGYHTSVSTCTAGVKFINRYSRYTCMIVVPIRIKIRSTSPLVSTLMHVLKMAKWKVTWLHLHIRVHVHKMFAHKLKPLKSRQWVCWQFSLVATYQVLQPSGDGKVWPME